jgi:hypothetical protein
VLRTEAHSNGPSRNSPENRPNPVLGFFSEYCAIVSKTNPATLIAVGITPGTFNFRRDKLVAEEKKLRDRGNQRKNLEKLSYGIPNADDNQLGIVNRF